MITGCSDGFVKFWNFKEGDLKKPIHKLHLDDGIKMFRSHRESAMLCVAMENFSLLILDCDTRTIVRNFIGHTGEITDADFSPDSRWLISSAMDCTLKVWDIPSSYMIDHFRVKNVL